MIFCNLKDNKIINVQFPVEVNEDELKENELTPLETCKIGLNESDYIVLNDDNGVIDKTTQIYNEYGQPLYEIVNDKPVLISDSDRLIGLKQIYKKKISKLAFEKRNIILPDYKISNAGIDMYDEQVKTKIKTCVGAFQDEYYRMEALVGSAKNENDLKIILDENQYDNITFEE